MHREAEEELVRSGLVTSGDLHAAKEKSRVNRASILLNLLEGRTAENCRAITESLAQHYKIPMLSMKKVVPPQEIMNMCNAKQSRKLHFLPVAMHGNQIVVGMVDPLDLNLSDEIRAIFQRTVQPVFISLDDFEHNYYRFFRKGVSLPSDGPELMNTIELKKAFLGSNENGLSGDEKSLIAKKFAARIISKALESGASGFSIEPQQDVCLVNITLEGTEYNLYRFAISYHKAIVEAMLRLAKIDAPSDKGIDQFSRCQVRFRDQEFILAYSFRHSPTGDRVVVHILDPRLNTLSIDHIGITNSEKAHLEQVMDAPGIIVVTGSSGSGKSTLLQAMTRHAVAQGKSTFTVEDIVGLKIEGARQFQPKPDGPDKSKILAALQSKKAQVIVVDEIDKASFPAAVECARAGALVLLSITAPDISEALSRVLRSGVSRSTLEPLLKIACIHKVVRKICPDCKTNDTPHSTTLSQWQIPDHIQFQIGAGCETCKQSGFQGTINLTELFYVSENIAAMIRQGASGPELFQQARHEGMLTLIEKGMNKAIDGATSLEEILASLPFDVPFSVKDQMRMGRVMPRQKDGDKASGKKDKDAQAADLFTNKTPIVDGDKIPIIKEKEKVVAMPSAPAAVQADDNKANILLVDDSQVTLEFTRHILEVSGYFNVDTTDTASKALAMLQEKQYHLVITDQNMPEQTGQEFIESIRQHPSLNSVGTILLTGNLNEMSALGGGADGYIAKPTDPELLVARAKSIADIYKRLSAPAAAKPAAPAPLRDLSAAKTDGKVDFTEKDMNNISSFELDSPNLPSENSNSVTPEIVNTDEEVSEFESLFK